MNDSDFRKVFLMDSFYFSEALQKAGLNPEDVGMIRHSLHDKTFRECYEADMVLEYTCHQKNNFAKDKKYLAVFISGESTTANFYALYKIGERVPDTRDNIPHGLPLIEANQYNGEMSFLNLTSFDAMKEYEGKIVIEWGKSAVRWYQKDTKKAIISIRSESKEEFPGFEELILPFDKLNEIINDPTTYGSWHTALKSVFAIYLIVDNVTGKQYVGSAYQEKDGLFGRWKQYTETHHGGDKELIDLITQEPDRYHEFQFSILQQLPKTLPIEKVINTESLWKKKLGTRRNGYNDN